MKRDKYMGNLLTLHYWFNLRPGALSPNLQMAYIMFIGLSLLLTVVFWYIRKQNKKSLYNRVWKRLYSLNLTNLIIGIFFLFFTFELIPLLSARFWFLLWGVAILVWLFFIGKAFYKIPKLREEMAKEEVYKKYIP